MVNERVISICRELLASGISILLVEQNIHIAEALSERVYVLLGGKTVYEGKTGGEFLADPELRHKYLGV